MWKAILPSVFGYHSDCKRFFSHIKESSGVTNEIKAKNDEM